MIDPCPGPSKDSRDEKIPRAGPGQCKVCEGPATGFHYSAQSCPACKTFFRRIVINQRRYLCVDNGLPESSSVGHLRICKKCRFDRCISAGMDPIAVLSGSPNASMNSVVKEILNRRRSSSSGASSEYSGSPEMQLVEQPRVIEIEVQMIINRMLYVNEAYTKIRRSKYQPPLDSTYNLESMIKGPSKFGIVYGDMPGWPINWDQLAAPNRKSLASCIKTGAPIPANFYERHSNTKRWSIADPAYAVEFTKTFDFFWALDQRDKIIICKHVTLMVSHLTQAFYSYERGSTCTEFPDGYRPFGGRIPEDSEPDKLLYTKAIGILKGLRMDREEYVLLKAIVVCNPAIFGLSSSARVILTNEREKYAKSLLSYTLARRGVEEGPSAFASMMAFVSTLEHISARIREILHALLALGIFSESKTAPFSMDFL